MEVFQYGAFYFKPECEISQDGQVLIEWSLNYGEKPLGTKLTHVGTPQKEIINGFSDLISAFVLLKKQNLLTQSVYFYDKETDCFMDSFKTMEIDDMTHAIDDKSQYWLCNREKSKALPLDSIRSYIHTRIRYEATASSWIAQMLPKDTLAFNAKEWKAPTGWHFRHIVGEGSFTGRTIKNAADAIGVATRKIIKYSQSNGDKDQSIGFAEWHMLLYKFKLKRDLF